VTQSHTSMKPSTLPVTNDWPSSENAAASACDLAPNYNKVTITLFNNNYELIINIVIN